MCAYKIAEARKIKGWNQAQLAEAIGTTQQVISRYESGEREPRVSAFEKMSRAMGVTLSFLLGVSDNPYATPSAPADIPMVPVVGRIAAGDPREAIAQTDEYAPLPPQFVNDGYEYIWFQLSGNSMNKHFASETWLLIRFVGEVKNGEIGAFMVNGDDATVKRVRYEDDGVHLVPESYDPEYREIFISKNDPSAPSFRPLGPVVYFRAKDGWRG